MSEVLIVAKTQMNNALCVGGLSLNGHENVRLLNRGNRYQPEDTDFEIGQIWEINFIPRDPVFPPHIEDVIVLDKEYLRDIDSIPDYLNENELIDWRGSPNILFDQLLNWTDNGSGFCTEQNGYPGQSVGFWVSDRNLTHYKYRNKSRYLYSNNHNITYKGLDEPIDVIEAGTVLRVSLSRPTDIRERGVMEAWLQLSGWY